MHDSPGDHYLACAALTCCADFDTVLVPRVLIGDQPDLRVHETAHGTLVVVTDPVVGEFVVLGPTAGVISRLLARLWPAQAPGPGIEGYAAHADRLLKDAESLMACLRSRAATRAQPEFAPETSARALYTLEGR